MVWRHGGEHHRHRGDVGGAVETRHGISSRVLLGSRLVFLSHVLLGSCCWSSMMDEMVLLDGLLKKGRRLQINVELLSSLLLGVPNL